MYVDVKGDRAADVQERLRQAAARVSARPSATDVNTNSGITAQSRQQSERRGHDPASSATSPEFTISPGASSNPYERVDFTQALPGSEKRYLILCINTGGMTSGRVHHENIDLTDIKKDDALFQLMREKYEATRKSTRGYFVPITKLFSCLFGELSLTIPGGANFVRVSQHDPTPAVSFVFDPDFTSFHFSFDLFPSRCLPMLLYLAPQNFHPKRRS